METSQPEGVEKLNEMRMLGALKGLAELLGAHGVEKWAGYFRGDLEDYLAARDGPNQNQRQLAVVVHVLTAFGGMNDFNEVVLTGEDGRPLAEENERLQKLAAQLWAAARGMQAALSTRQSPPAS